MFNNGPINCRIIEDVDLPTPATKLIITQHLAASRDSPFWAWIIVGAFYDRQGNTLWSTKIFLGYLGVDSDGEATDSEGSVSVTESEAEEVTGTSILSSLEPDFGIQRSTRLGSSSSRSSSWLLERFFRPPSLSLGTYLAATLNLFPDTPISRTSIMSGGWNPMSGRDSRGARPNGAPAGAPIPTQGQPYIPHVGGPGYNFGLVPTPYGVMYAGGAAYGQPAYVLPQGPVAGFQNPLTYANQPNGNGNIFGRQTQPHPQIDTQMPAAQMTNSTGGVGCEPGYNYFFPAEHTKVHVFKSETPPWQLDANAQIPFIASHVPTSTKLGDLLKGFGCTNPNPKKNKCFELYSGGNGKWYKGYSFNGDEENEMEKSLDEVGWTSDRTGSDDGKPVVCLWFCKS
ncbi:unnamed protein product [Fusarium venenatum]|uniref:Uncharacterized protein n=1 Tax=Fusarium venenatum TaxID=56646 RepID=A0A2L2TGY8_9HYPO|nr:uncharacterized protein FVRRES_10309 [Fusarium venenatum]KAH6966929.1 hypothetical protein EDB82DRAFT_481221 [Fusarium venenatum]CEI70232.1 unnamed protein product [Fusarium venenatum]